MHKVFDQVQSGTDLPLLHILDATVTAIQRAGLSRVGVLGTRFTMAEDFYKDHLLANGISSIIPHQTDQEIAHKIIVEELVRGILTEQSKQC